MKTIKLSNDHLMPMIGLGTIGLAPAGVYDTIRQAIRLGYRLIDCAPSHGNQAQIGKAILDAISDGDVSREDLFITSKLPNDQHRYNDVEASCQSILAELQLDYLDLFLIQWPVAHERGILLPGNEEEFLSDGEAPLEDTWTGMEDCLDAELVRHIGVSNFNIPRLQLLLDEATFPPEVNQCEWHPYLPQQTLYDYCRSQKVKMMAYAPLGTPGTKTAGEPDLFTEPAIMDIARKYNCTEAQVLLAYGLQRKMAVIPCSGNATHLAENLAADNVELDREDLRSLIILPKHRFYKGEEYTIHGSPYKLTDLWEY